MRKTEWLKNKKNSYRHKNLVTVGFSRNSINKFMSILKGQKTRIKKLVGLAYTSSEGVEQTSSIYIFNKKYIQNLQLLNRGLLVWHSVRRIEFFQCSRKEWKLTEIPEQILTPAPVYLLYNFIMSTNKKFNLKGQKTRIRNWFSLPVFRRCRTNECSIDYPRRFEWNFWQQWWI